MSVIDLTSSVTYASLSAAISGSSAGDVIQLSPGLYDENFPNITHSLTIQSEGGLAHLVNPQPVPVNGRAVLNVPGNLGVNLTISGLEISGAVDNQMPYPNGAGILFETGNGVLTINNSWIHNNQDGILVGGTPGTSVVVSHSEFNNNGNVKGAAGSGYTHNIYVGAVDSLTITDSYFHDAIQGHEIKSRAHSTTIIGNRIQGQQFGGGSSAIDISDGGAAVISNNVLEQGANAANRYAITFAPEGTYSGSSLTVSGNSFIADRAGGTTALYNASNAPSGGTNHTIPATITGNTFYGFEGGPNHINQDRFNPPYDIMAGNALLPGAAAPPLDTGHPFAVPEPASVLLMPAALFATAALRARRRWALRR